MQFCEINHSKIVKGKNSKVIKDIDQYRQKARETKGF